MGAWKLKLFGAFELTSPQGEPVRLAERKARALLAYVALARGHSASREALLGLLWESRPVAQARQSLRQVVHRLRIATGEPALLAADGDALAVDPRRVQLDVWEFLDAAQGNAPGDLQRAASLYASPPLASLDVDEPEFDAWLRSMRLQLGQAASALFRRLALAHHGEGDSGAAIDACKQWLAADPNDEEAYRLLMQMYAVAGDRAGLKWAFAALEAMCATRLDSSPTDDSKRLFRTLLGDTPFPALVAREPQARAAGASAPNAAPPAVAVLRWQCAREDPDQCYLADAVCEELMLTLGSMRSMRVLGRGASFVAPTEIGEALRHAHVLGADYLIGGTLRRQADCVKVAAWLAEVKSGEVVWTRRYREPVQDLFSLHEDLAYRIAASIEPSLNRVELRAVQRKPPRDMTAYDILQRGYWNFYQGQFDAARRCFSEAIERDSGFAHAYAMLALVLYFSGQVRRTEAWPDQLEQAYGMALKASLLDPDDAKAHVVLGQTSSWLGRYAEADEALSRAATLNPSLALATSAKSYLSLMQGEFEGAIRNLNVAVRYRTSDPALGLCLPSQALANYLMGNYADALEIARRALALRPDFWCGQHVLAAALGRMGRAGEAADVLQAMRRQAFESNPAAFAARVPYTDAKWTHEVSEGLAQAGWR